MRDPVTEGRYLQQQYARAVRPAPCASAAPFQRQYVQQPIAALRYRLGAVMLRWGQHLLGAGASSRSVQLLPTMAAVPSVGRRLSRSTGAFVPAGILAWQAAQPAFPSTAARPRSQDEEWYMAVVFRCEASQAWARQLPVIEW